MADEADPTPRDTLARRFMFLYGASPPRRLPVSILQLAIAYREQEARMGPIKPSDRRRLMSYADSEARLPGMGRKKPAPAAPVIKAGTLLIREWQGVTYTVQIIEEGVVFDGKTYSSLTAVAQQITGQHYSGPRFFGLKSPRLLVAGEGR